MSKRGEESGASNLSAVGFPAPASQGGEDEMRVVAFDGAEGAEKGLTELLIRELSLIGSGSFGHVASAFLCDPTRRSEDRLRVAIKKVLLDKKVKNRELELTMKMSHPNIVSLLYYFYSYGEGRRGEEEEVYLHLVMEFLPETLYRLSRDAVKRKELLALPLVQVLVYQLFRGLAYCHSIGLCHRDIKPQNLLVDSAAGLLKLCDFGSAKLLSQDTPNIAYICSRYYRAPELLFGATDYGFAVDTWAGGCVFAELLLGRPLFQGQNAPDQLVEIIRVLGSPNQEEMVAMKPAPQESLPIPAVDAYPWDQVFPPRTSPQAVTLVSQILRYHPGQRLRPLQVAGHGFFDALRKAGARLPNGRPLPGHLFTFSGPEIEGASPTLLARLRPAAAASNTTSNSRDHPTMTTASTQP